jgi:TIR domain
MMGNTPPGSMPLSVFYPYSYRDEDLRQELEKHLALLQRQGTITGWHNRRLAPGDPWRGQIDSHLRSADVILLLISADFLVSEYCDDVEMKLALERHRQKQALVIPLLLRPADWSAAPFAHLRTLPRNAQPVTAWSDREQAFAEVATAIAISHDCADRKSSARFSLLVWSKWLPFFN